jgi:hypothetical protein
LDDACLFYLLQGVVCCVPVAVELVGDLDGFERAQLETLLYEVTQVRQIAYQREAI